MADRPPQSGFVRFLLYMVYIVAVPLAWMRAWTIAGRHSDVDPRARGKTAAGIVVGVLLAAGLTAGLFVLYQDGKAGAYDAMEGRLAPALGDDAYQDAIDIIEGSLNTMRVAAVNLDQANAPDDLFARYDTTWSGLLDDGGVVEGFRTTTDVAGTADRLERDLDELDALARQMNGSLPEDSDARRTFGGAHDNATAEAREHLVKARGAAEGHALYRNAIPLAQAQDDERLRATLEASPVLDDAQAREQVDQAFAVKDKALKDMRLWGFLFFVPLVIGVLYAPLVWALGSVLRAGFEPSEGVGYKRYPGGAMGWVLLLGAGGWLVWVFAAWTLQDMDSRSLEGQITL